MDCLEGRRDPQAYRDGHLPYALVAPWKGADIPRTHQENDPLTQLRLFWEAFCSRENPVSCTVLAGALALCGGARRF